MIHFVSKRKGLKKLNLRWRQDHKEGGHEAPRKTILFKRLHRAARLKDKGRCDMALMNLRQNFSGRAAAAGIAAALALSPMVGASAQDAQPQAEFTQVALTPVVEDAGLQAGRYSREHPGIAIAVYLGTDPGTPSRERIAEVLAGDFQRAGLRGPVTFFFEQNDVAGSGATFHFDGAVRGPFTLNESRAEVPNMTQAYNFRLERGLLASVDLSQ